MYYDRFIPEWIKRSERQQILVDDGDRFISLWIAFNGWMRKEYGEDKADSYLINCVIKNVNFEQIFNDLKIKNKGFQENLNHLANFRVINMKYKTDESHYEKFTGNFESLIRVIYQIRCNLFHGRKNVDENKIDLELIKLALELLRVLFKTYLKEKGLKLFPSNIA